MPQHPTPASAPTLLTTEPLRFSPDIVEESKLRQKHLTWPSFGIIGPGYQWRILRVYTKGCYRLCVHVSICVLRAPTHTSQSPNPALACFGPVDRIPGTFGISR
ncbi:hypothetical protein CBL_10702 [Carabus blaptoides fortunei]